jgi:hypothetical protein
MVVPEIKQQRQQHGRTTVVYGELWRRRAPRWQTPTNGSEPRNQSLKLGGPIREGPRPLGVPRQRSRPWASRGRERRTASAPARDRLAFMLTACSRDRWLGPTTGRDEDPWGNGPCPGQPPPWIGQHALKGYSNDS